MEMFIPHSCFCTEFTSDKQVTITGFINNPAPDGFSINLCCDPKFGGNVALHFNPRFDQGYVAINTMTGDKWGEEKGVCKMPFTEGHDFEVIIRATRFNSYQIYVNGDKFADYQARLPMENVKYLYIGGSKMKLYKVQLGEFSEK